MHCLLYFVPKPNTECRYLRVDFNPSNDIVPWSLARQLFGFFDIDSTNVTRIDVAVDLPISMFEVIAWVPRSRKLETRRSAGRVESTVIGGTKRQLRQYDKTIKTRWYTPPKGLLHRTRFESQTRQTGLSLLELPSFENPFATLELHPLIASGLPLERRLLASYAQLVGLTELRAELGSAGFNRLCRDLEAGNNAPVLPHPAQLFDERWANTANDLLVALGVR